MAPNSTLVSRREVLLDLSWFIREVGRVHVWTCLLLAHILIPLSVVMFTKEKVWGYMFPCNEAADIKEQQMLNGCPPPRVWIPYVAVEDNI